MKRYEIYKVEAQEPSGKWHEVTTYPSFLSAEHHVHLEQRPENGTLIPFRIVMVKVTEESEVVQTYGVA